MEASTVNLFDEILVVIENFDPEESITQQLAEKLSELKDPINQLRNTRVPISGLFRKLVSELEALKSSLHKLNLRCSRAVNSVYKDGTEIEHVKTIIRNCGIDLRKLLKESPEQMLGKAIISDLLGSKSREQGSSGSASTGVDIFQEENPIIISNTIEISKVPMNPYAQFFYLKYFKSQPTNIALEEFMNSLRLESTERGDLWTPDFEAKERQKLTDPLDLLTFNLYFSSFEMPSSDLQKLELSAEEKIYSGGIVQGLKHGSGDLEYSDGRTYKGDFVDGKRSGTGTYTWPDGRVYVGGWKDDDLTGEGVLTHSDGRRYEGGFSRGLMHGKGIYNWPDGKRYIGEFINGLIEGYGVICTPEGMRYEGELVANKKHGRGTHFWSDGSRYEGGFKDDKKHGKGIMFDTDGQTFEGEWVEDDQTS